MRYQNEAAELWQGIKFFGSCSGVNQRIKRVIVVREITLLDRPLLEFSRLRGG